jgi:regulator of RNase E activity RraA
MQGEEDMTPDVTPEALESLRAIGTATLSNQLGRLGIRRHVIDAARPLLAGHRIAGPAFTLRFIHGREDICTPESYTLPGSLMEAVEMAPPGAVLVIEAHGVTDSGTLGDVLALRLKLRGVAGAVSDGSVRDLAGLRRVDWPIWSAGTTAPPSIESLWFAGWDMPVGCGGVAVFPGDIIVADEDAAIVVPPSVLPSVLEGALAHEEMERFIVAEVAKGRSTRGLYPPDAETRAEFERLRAQK